MFGYFFCKLDDSCLANFSLAQWCTYLIRVSGSYIYMCCVSIRVWDVGMLAEHSKQHVEGMVGNQPNLSRNPQLSLPAPQMTLVASKRVSWPVVRLHSCFEVARANK